MRKLPDESLFAPDGGAPVECRSTDAPSTGSCVIALVTLPVTVTVCALNQPAQNSQAAAFTAAG